MSKNDRATVRVENLAYSNMLTLNALVELLDERGILQKREVLERIKRLGEESRDGGAMRPASPLYSSCVVNGRSDS